MKDYDLNCKSVIKNAYDVIIVGGGLGGLAAGVILASHQYITLLIEKNERLGGRFPSYYKDGFTIDVGTPPEPSSSLFRKF